MSAKAPGSARSSAMASSTGAANFESGRQQHESNVRLRRAVLEADELLQRVHTASSGAASKRRSDAAKAMSRSLELLADFERMCSYKTLRRPNPERLMSECKLRMPVAELVKPGDRCANLEFLTRVGDVLKRFKSNKATVAPLTTFADTGVATVDKAASILRETSLDGCVWSNLPDPLFVLLEEVISLPPTESLLEEQNEALRRMAFSVEEMTQQQEQAVADGDMKLVETLYLKKITVQEAMVDIYNKMFAALDEQYREAFVAPLKRVHEVHKKTNADIATVLQSNDAKRDRVKTDLATLDGLVQSLRDESAQAEQRFTALQESSDRFLKDNQTHTDQCYAAMEELERQISKLAAERAEAIQKRLLGVDEEQRRRADTAVIEAFAQSHRQLLETTAMNCEAAEEINDLMDELLCAGCNSIEQRMRDIDASIERERQALHAQRLQHFRQLYLTMGDLQYKKERHIEELDKKIEQIHIQQELAMETFNPKAKEFSQMKKDLLKVREDMQTQVQVLSDKAVLQIEAFKPTEAALLQSGKPFVHPVEELAAKNRNRQQKLIEYHQLMESESGPAAAPADLQKEMLEIEEMKQKTMPRRPLHSSQGGRQSSSAGGGGLGSLNGSPTKAQA